MPQILGEPVSTPRPYIKVCRGKKIKPKESLKVNHFSIEGLYGRNCGIFLRQVGGLCRFREFWGFATLRASLRDVAVPLPKHLADTTL